MWSGDAEDRLRELLAGAGVDLGAPTAEDVGRTWTVLRAFAEEGLQDAELQEDDSDAFLAQFGTYDWGEGEHFSVGITRQFIFYEDGEYDRMAQLDCTFEFEPTDPLRGAGAGDLWSFDITLDAFFAQALALPGFRAVDGLAPRRLTIGYGDV